MSKEYYVWVKASEELPEEFKMLSLRITKDNGETFLETGYYSKGDCMVFSAKGYYLPDEIEWLKPIIIGQQCNTEKTGSLIKRFGEVIVERDKLKKELEQERFNHTNTRISWDATLKKMDKHG